MIRYFAEQMDCNRTAKPVMHSLLSLAYFLIMVLGSFLIPTISQSFQADDEVVVQNTFLDGLDVYVFPKTTPEKIFDGTRGTILDGPVIVSSDSWYKVRWRTSPEITGWSIAAKDGCNVIGTAEKANQRDKIVAKLFNLNQQEVDAKTNHEYNGHGCNVNWEENGEPVYNGGHSGWDAQTKSAFDPDRNANFYSLTTGKVIRADEGTSSTTSVIAVYDEEHGRTTLYLHARAVHVQLDKNVTVGDLLGQQGNTGLKRSNDTAASHVHIEVAIGEIIQPSTGTEDTTHLTVDPITYLYDSIISDEQQRGALGGAQLPEPDVNGDNQVDILDLFFVWAYIGRDADAFPPADVNGDGKINKADIVAVAENLDVPEIGAPAVFSHKQIAGVTIREGCAYIGDIALSRNTVQQWLSITREADDNSLVFKRSIAVLKSILSRITPNKTLLFSNYPNPFNPETWIPYQLSEPAEVTLTIHDIKGHVVRSLDLEHQRAGVYQSRSRAAYWDGKNEVGEPVASGVYFYTLTAGDFSATRRMLIRK